MKGLIILCFIFTICLLNYVQSLTDAEAKSDFTKVIMQCTKDFPVEMSELLLLKQLQMPEKKETKCMLACAYRKMKTMDDKGMFDLEQGYKIAEQLKNGDEKRLENGRKMADVCNKVNNVKVSDGEKGCERAALMFKCTIENAPKFGFEV